jgi:cytochrome c biogenesis factor
MEPGAMVNGPWKGSHLPQVAVISVLLFFCVFVAVTNLWRAIELGKRSKLGIGPFISHLGIAVLLSGLIVSKGLERTEKVIIRDGVPGTALGYKIAFKDFDPSRYYDRSNVVKFDVTTPDGKHHEIDPNLYYYQAGDKEEAQTWPFIERTLSHDMYFFMQKPSVEYWEVPMNLKPGETKTQGAVTVTYNRMTRTGEPGQMGVEFGADLTVSYDNNTYKAKPTLTMTDHGLEPSLPVLSTDFRIAMTSMNANDRSVNLQLFLSPPLYPFQVFYKPLTCLVWIGTGIFTLGGLLSAFYRRAVRKSPEGDFKAKTATIDTNGENASITTA